ncbi:ubiquitin carboxyl-terminal hydrolase 37-like [Cebidichthys violaceus]|uniref:ubiquitin carboxyl-terminal hydrolase 37-like n=1 Tax=Cebidichthys violaceus TaxID=271503 RepID=UPI0035C9970F
MAGQKDAHEFLNCVVDNLTSLSADLETTAVNMGYSYTCPVNAHVAFQMLSTRTCKGCGHGFDRDEEVNPSSVALPLVSPSFTPR